jgi:hypothetical protein
VRCIRKAAKHPGCENERDEIQTREFAAEALLRRTLGRYKLPPHPVTIVRVARSQRTEPMIRSNHP